MNSDKKINICELKYINSYIQKLTTDAYYYGKNGPVVLLLYLNYLMSSHGWLDCNQIYLFSRRILNIAHFWPDEFPDSN